MSDTVFCKDCKHCSRDLVDAIFRVDNFKCKHNKSFTGGHINLVTGKRIGGRYAYCNSARMNLGHCKPDGIFWEPKNTKKFLLTILKREN